jgi:hypothetical protein
MVPENLGVDVEGSVARTLDGCPAGALAAGEADSLAVSVGSAESEGCEDCLVKA